MSRVRPMVSNPTCEYAIDPLGLITPHPRFAWQVAGSAQMAYRVLVATSPILLAGGHADAWDSGWVIDDHVAQIAYAGLPLASRDRRWWQVEVRDTAGQCGTTAPAVFEMGLLTPADWGSAEWIGAPGIAPGRACCFRAVLTAGGTVCRARLYAAGLGSYRLYLNGQAVSDRVLDPPPTAVEQRVPYTVHDVTALISAEDTVLAAVVGHGWYGRPIVKLRLEVQLIDGRELTLVSGPQHPFVTRPGGTLADGLFLGETYDARCEPTGWLLPDYRVHIHDLDRARRSGERHEQWTGAYRVSGPGGTLTSDLMEPIRVVEDVIPHLVTKMEKSTWVFDAGSNLAGWCRLRVRAAAGTRITMTYGETLCADGLVNQDNLYTARAADVYTCAGAGEESWEPRFTYHGFRYVQIDGLPGAPEVGTLVVRRVRNDLARRGRFACADELVQRIHTMIVRTEESNQHGVPTDCPQRAERQGWLNDQTARAEQLIHNFHAPSFISKWLADLGDAQDPVTGAIPDTVPWHFGHRQADPVCVCPIWYPWLLWRHHGDRQVLTNHWSMMTAWQRCVASTATAGLVDYSWWGDWCPPQAFAVESDPCRSRDTPSELVSNAHLVFMTRLLSRIAHVIGKIDDALRYTEEANVLVTAINRTWLEPHTASYGTNIQACNAMALWMDLVPETQRPAVFARLVEDVEQRGQLTTGNICTKYVLETLADGGRADLAWRLVTRRAYPSWGFMLDQGATTLWERWEKETGAGMNSHNHSMLGAVDAWLYTRLVGLRDDETAFPGDGFLLTPQVVPGLTHAEAELDTMRGRLALSWQRTDQGVIIAVEVPNGAHAAFTAPLGWVLEDGGDRLCLPAGCHDLRLMSALPASTCSAATSRRALECAL